MEDNLVLRAHELAKNSLYTPTEAREMVNMFIERNIIPVGSKRGFMSEIIGAYHNTQIYLLKNPENEGEIIVIVHFGGEENPYAELRASHPETLSQCKETLDLNNPHESFEKFLDKYKM